MALTPADNKEIVRAYWEEFFNQGNLALADDLLAADFVVHESGATEEEGGPKSLKVQSPSSTSSCPISGSL